jgi:hypothetical protein
MKKFSADQLLFAAVLGAVVLLVTLYRLLFQP